MKERDVQLKRLFETARLAPPQREDSAMPWQLKRRVLTSWRAGVEEEAGTNLALVFRGALACAAVVMLASIAWSLGELAHDPENDVAIANYELRADVMQ